VPFAGSQSKEASEKLWQFTGAARLFITGVSEGRSKSLAYQEKAHPASPGRSAFAFLSAAGGWFREHERSGTLIQVTGGSARRAMAGRGLWAAGSFAVRAITNASALELREQGIHVALLIVDAGIEPIAGGGRPGVDPAALADPRDLARAVLFLADQGARGTTHELQITPLAERWVP